MWSDAEAFRGLGPRQFFLRERVVDYRQSAIQWRKAKTKDKYASYPLLDRDRSVTDSKQVGVDSSSRAGESGCAARRWVFLARRDCEVYGLRMKGHPSPFFARPKVMDVHVEYISGTRGEPPVSLELSMS